MLVMLQSDGRLFSALQVWSVHTGLGSVDVKGFVYGSFNIRQMRIQW